MAENVVFCHIYFTIIQKNTQKTQTGEKGWAERKTQFSPRPRSSHGALAFCLPGEATLIKSIHTTQALPGVVLFNRNYSLQGARPGLLPACVCPGTFLFQVTSCVALPGPGSGGGRQVRTTRSTLPPLTGSPWGSVTQREQKGVPSGASAPSPGRPGVSADWPLLAPGPPSAGGTDRSPPPSPAGGPQPQTGRVARSLVEGRAGAGCWAPWGSRPRDPFSRPQRLLWVLCPATGRRCCPLGAR